MQDLIGKTLGPYQIKKQIGKGGMATVFQAYQPSLDRFVAIKVLSPELAEVPGFTERFQREARAVASLNHPNILPVYDFGIEDNHNYIAMRYVENSVTLDRLMHRGASLDEMLNHVVQVADALNFAHKQGVVHRDVKPSNILIDGKWAFLSDFGLVQHQDGNTHLTATGRSLGTPAYMAPEQASGGRVDHRADIYALGIILYEILTGSIPHDAKTPLQIAVKRTNEPVSSPRLINPNISAGLEHVTLRALVRSPEMRYDDANDFAAALQHAYRDPDFREDSNLATASFPVPNPEPTLSVSPPKNQSLFIWGGAVVVVIALLIGVMFSWGGLGSRNAQSSGASTTPDTVDSGAALASTDQPTATPPLPTDTPTPISNGTPIAITTAELEVWSGPGDAYDLLGYLPGGVTAEIKSRDRTGDWWQIRTSLSPDGLGWVKAADTRATATEGLPIAVIPVPATPTPTDTPLLRPSDTPTPTATTITSPTVTATTTPTPTARPALPTATSTTTPKPTPTVPTGEFTLLKPASLEEPSFGLTEFEWQWDTPLAKGQGFEVRVWRDDDFPQGVHDAVLDNKAGTIKLVDNSTYRLEVDITEAAGVKNRKGEYNWAVVLVQIEPEYKDLGIQAPPGRLRFEPFVVGGDGGSDGSGGGGGTLVGGD